MSSETFSEADAFELAWTTQDDLTWSQDEDETPADNKYNPFLLQQYDICKADYERFGIIPLNPLNKGYFTVVSPEDYQQLTRYAWSANIQVDKVTGKVIKIYAYRKARKTERNKGAPIYIYLHRYIAGVTLSGKTCVVDHRCGHSLDNRRCNLVVTNQRNNIGNTQSRKRSTNPSLPRGAKPVKRTRDGKRVTMFIGRIRVGSNRELRSKTTFSCAIRAGRWYQRMHSLIHPSACLVNNASKPPEPICFPPKLEIFDDVPF